MQLIPVLRSRRAPREAQDGQRWLHRTSESVHILAYEGCFIRHDRLPAARDKI
ncbi:MAG: hypothetical protein K0S27_66 [Gammaproteobacteria bacterium]|jgi:hypothetical protein|nr:hypothetical protein [Gammaproteobacteria bacterium]